MENASKALLIAAAVLIVILLIALGMSIVNSSGDTAGQAEATASTQQVQMFNAQFQGYLGLNKKGSVVRNLLVAINNSNARNSNHQVKLLGNMIKYYTGVKKYYIIKELFNEGKNYNITVEKYGDNGYIEEIRIKVCE